MRALSRALSLCRYLTLSVPSRSFCSHTHRALSLSRSTSTATSGTIATLPCACQRVAAPPCQSVTTKWNRQTAQHRMAHLWRLSNLPFSRASCPLLRFAKPNCALTSGRPRPAGLTDATLSARRPASGCELAPRRYASRAPSHMAHEIALVRTSR